MDRKLFGSFRPKNLVKFEILHVVENTLISVEPLSLIVKPPEGQKWFKNKKITTKGCIKSIFCPPPPYANNYFLQKIHMLAHLLGLYSVNWEKLTIYRDQK